MSARIPHFLLPRGLPLQFKQSTLISHQLPLVRYASSKPKASKPISKGPIVLEKPAKFNPPSHGQRIKATPRNYPGPKLSDLEEQEKKTKQYPHMMPAEGTAMHWFLTNKSIHIYIAFVGFSLPTAEVLR
jgi:hypothetical protein